MKGLKILSCFVCLALLVSAVAFATEPAAEEITAAYADGVLTLDVYVSELAAEGVTNIDAEITTENVQLDADGAYSASITGYEGTEASVTADGSVLEIAIDAFDFSIAEKTKVLSLSVPVEYTGLEAEITETVTFSSTALGVEDLTCDVDIEAETKVEAEIELVSGMTAYDSVSVKLVAEGAEDVSLDIDEEASTDEKIVIVAVNAAAVDFTAENYKLVVSCDGYLDGESDTFAVASGADLTIDGFLPGDVDADEDIDIYDFNALCTYISSEYGDSAKCDLDKDGDVDKDDATSLFAGFNGGAE